MSNPTNRRTTGSTVLIRSLLMAWALAAPAAASASPLPGTSRTADLEALPLYFTTDADPAGGPDRFAARVPGADIGLSADGAIFRLRGPDAGTESAGAGTRAAITLRDAGHEVESQPHHGH